jgi:hypothetical protein
MKHFRRHMNNLETATTIYQQLGGQRFSVMTGAKNFGGTENSLSFKVGRNAGGVTHVKITLTPMDEYNMEFLAVRGTTIREVKRFDGVYCDQLTDLFTEVTGMHTSL